MKPITSFSVHIGEFVKYHKHIDLDLVQEKRYDAYIRYVLYIMEIVE